MMVHLASLFLGWTSPKDKDQALAMEVELLDHFVGEPFPTPIGVGLRFGPLHREHTVEQEDSLLCPRF